VDPEPRARNEIDAAIVKIAAVRATIVLVGEAARVSGEASTSAHGHVAVAVAV